MNGTSYTYGSQPHAVTAAGQASYTYDDNGNMTDRDGQTITWDVENRPVSITDGQNTTTYVYDGEGNRILEIEGGETILYVNGYYEKNITTSVITTYYYLGSRLIAQRQGTDLTYVHQDHLTGTSLTTDSNGDSEGTIKYYPYGETRTTTGTLDTDKLFTGQRLDSTGLYYYNGRYYDAEIGRFISADPVVQWSSGFNVVSEPLTVNIITTGLGNIHYLQGDYPITTLEITLNPQTLNRYSYVLNNPLRYIDPTGYVNSTLIIIGIALVAIAAFTGGAALIGLATGVTYLAGIAVAEFLCDASIVLFAPTLMGGIGLLLTATGLKEEEEEEVDKNTLPLESDDIYGDIIDNSMNNDYEDYSFNDYGSDYSDPDNYYQYPDDDYYYYLYYYR